MRHNEKSLSAEGSLQVFVRKERTLKLPPKIERNFRKWKLLSTQFI